MSGYQRKTIRRILRAKLDHFINSIHDEAVKEAVRKDVLVTGGSISSMLLGEKVNDYDLYFRSYDTVYLVARYYVALFNRLKNSNDVVPYTPVVMEQDRKNIHGEMEKRVLIYMKSAGVAGVDAEPYTYFEGQAPQRTEDFMLSLATDDTNLVESTKELKEIVKKKDNVFNPVFLTDNAVTLTDKTQLIIRFYGTPEEIHKNFDYVHCTGIYDYAQDKLHVSPEMMESLLTKRLIYNGSLYPIASVLRMRKFLKRGWNISAGQVLKMLSQMQKIRWEDPFCLQEQLMGVDVAYMHQLITALQNPPEGQRIDETYLASLIDTIFDES